MSFIAVAAHSVICECCHFIQSWKALA